MNAQELRALRRKMGLRRPQLAARIGVSPRTIEAWEQGLRSVPKPVATLLQLLTKLGQHDTIMMPHPGSSYKKSRPFRQT